MKTVLNKTHPIPGFRYASVRPVAGPGAVEGWAEIEAPARRRGRWSVWAQAAPSSDGSGRREWTPVPLGGLGVRLGYAPRRVGCPAHGMRVDALPWHEGQRPGTRGMLVCLARWARRRSWRETAQAFGGRWEAVSRAVQGLVAWGLAHRVLAGITALGLDELQWRQGQRRRTAGPGSPRGMPGAGGARGWGCAARNGRGAGGSRRWAPRSWPASGWS